MKKPSIKPLLSALTSLPSLVCLASLPMLSCADAPSPQPPPSPTGIAIPESGAYTGAYIDFGDGEDQVTLEAIEDFEEKVGKKQAIIAFGSFWGRQSFPHQQMNIVRAYGAIPLVYWSPWDMPFMQKRGPDRFSLDRILAGEWDEYIDRWAEDAKNYGHPFFVAWGLEMNGTWFPWSGHFYGAGQKIPGTEDAFLGPDTFKRAYRHIVDRVRARGASNILWVYHANNYSYPWEKWNTIASYYPGDDYVDWLGLSVYGKQFRNNTWSHYKDLLDYPYRDITSIAPDKPLMIAEWGVGEFPDSGDKGAWIADAFRLMRQDYPKIKTAIFWHERWQNEDGSFSNLRVHSSQGSLDAYREGVAHDHWLPEPIWNFDNKSQKKLTK